MKKLTQKNIHDEEKIEVAKPIPDLTIAQKVKFMEKVVIHKNSCWTWSGDFHGGKRYGRITVDNKKYSAHRVSYEIFNGRKLKTNLVIDHICKNTKCVNPEHLEEVTQKENVLRSDFGSVKNANKTHCINGHKFSEGNFYTYTNKRGTTRICKLCRKAQRIKKQSLRSYE